MRITTPALKIALTLCLLFLYACNTSHNIKPFTPQLADSEQASVYIYRPPAMSNAIYSPDLYINDEFKLAIKNGTNTRLTLAPGEYKFDINPEQNYAGKTSLTLNLGKGKIHYLRVNTSLKLKSSFNYEPYQRRFYLIQAEETPAINEITDCCLNTEKKLKSKAEISPHKKTAEEGFSIDKTQNPFSH